MYPQNLKKMGDSKKTYAIPILHSEQVSYTYFDDTKIEKIDLSTNVCVYMQYAHMK